MKAIAIVLLSGGVNSTVTLAQALKSRECIPITFDYRQQNHAELEAAKRITSHYGLRHKVISISPNTFANTQSGREAPLSPIYQHHIPRTYLPGGNTLFLAYAAGQAEIYGANEIYFGVSATDGSPTIRQGYIQTFQTLLQLASKQNGDGSTPQIVAPLIQLRKREIVRQGISLKAPLQLTMSCYDPSATLKHCGRCDACYLRKEGFIASGYKDPTDYAEQGLPLGAAEIGDMI